MMFHCKPAILGTPHDELELPIWSLASMTDWFPDSENLPRRNSQLPEPQDSGDAEAAPQVAQGLAGARGAMASGCLLAVHR